MKMLKASGLHLKDFRQEQIPKTNITAITPVRKDEEFAIFPDIRIKLF